MRLWFKGLFLLFIFLLACPGPMERDPARLVWHLGAEPDTLNPLTATDAYSSRINSYIYETLIRRDNETLELIPELAESWTISSDKLLYTFKLRRDVYWQDGEPFNADDVVYSYKTLQDPKVDDPHLKVYYRDIEKVTKIDDYTVQFKYNRPYFLALEFCGGMPILPQHVFDDGTDFNKHPAGRAPVGTGPFIFVRWDTNRAVVLKQNKNYWGKKPEIDEILFKIIQDQTVALQVLKKGEMDLMGLRPIQWARQTESEKFNSMFQRLEYYTPSYSYIGWNLRRPYFQDKMVRRALTMLIDREKILEKLYFGLGKIVTGNFYIFGPYYNKNIKPWPYDPEKAKKILDQAGWSDHDGDGIRDKDGVPFAFDFLVTAGARARINFVTIVKEDFKKAGIDVTIRQLEWSTFLKNLHDRDFDATTLGWAMGVEADPFQLWHSTQIEQGSNYVGFDNKEADKIIERARVEFNKEKRTKMYHRFHEILHEEQPYTFLYCLASLVVVDRRFTNVKAYPLGIDPREWKIKVRDSSPVTRDADF
jgi:peptide/nickel transport system substrate-binding protein